MPVDRLFIYYSTFSFFPLMTEKYVKNTQRVDFDQPTSRTAHGRNAQEPMMDNPTGLAI